MVFWLIWEQLIELFCILNVFWLIFPYKIVTCFAKLSSEWIFDLLKVKTIQRPYSLCSLHRSMLWAIFMNIVRILGVLFKFHFEKKRRKIDVDTNKCFCLIFMKSLHSHAHELRAIQQCACFWYVNIPRRRLRLEISV